MRTILSPHFDDAVLSCFSQLDNKATVITVFGGLPPEGASGYWDKLTGSGNSKARMLVRQKENERALKRTGCRIINLDYLDKMYRSEPTDVKEIANKLIDIVPKDDDVFVPLGRVGRFKHQDHIDVSQIGITLLSFGFKVRFYADIPYVLPIVGRKNWTDRLSLDVCATTLGINLSKEVVKLDRESVKNKLSALKAYSSQFKALNLLNFGAISNPKIVSQELILMPTNKP
jgi:LmbE family N-acetylglucosaminyl deacetylase